MNVFLIDQISRARYFSGVCTVKGKPRKIKPAERCVLYAIACSMKTDVDLKVQMSKSVMKKQNGGFAGTFDTQEKKVCDLLSREDKICRSEIARKLAMSTTRVNQIIDGLIKIGVLDFDLKIEVWKVEQDWKGECERVVEGGVSECEFKMKKLKWMGKEEDGRFRLRR